MSRRAKGGAVAPFTVYEFSCLRLGADLSWNGRHFATFDNAEGARRMADLLNAAVALAGDGHLVSVQPGYAPERIAALIAKALGGSIEFGSFARDEAA